MTPEVLDALSRLVAVVRSATVEGNRGYAEVLRASALEQFDTDDGGPGITGRVWSGHVMAAMAEVLSAVADAREAESR